MICDICDLCTRATVVSGKDTLLYEDRFCYIVDNGSTDGYRRRVTLIVTPHMQGSDMTMRVATFNLKSFAIFRLGIPESQLYICKTMNTYPEHFHIHACVLPKLDGEPTLQTSGLKLSEWGSLGGLPLGWRGRILR